MTASERDWFVSYDVTERSIVLHHRGDDPVNITADEAQAVRDDLTAAMTAEHEHRMLLDDDEAAAPCDFLHPHPDHPCGSAFSITPAKKWAQP